MIIFEFGMKSGLRLSRYPSENRDRVENDGFFVPEGGPEARCGMKSGFRSSRYPSK